MGSEYVIEELYLHPACHTNTFGTIEENIPFT